MVLCRKPMGMEGLKPSYLEHIRNSMHKPIEGGPLLAETDAKPHRINNNPKIFDLLLNKGVKNC
jgi:hypothetical protein